MIRGTLSEQSPYIHTPHQPNSILLPVTLELGDKSPSKRNARTTHKRPFTFQSNNSRNKRCPVRAENISSSWTQRSNPLRRGLHIRTTWFSTDINRAPKPQLQAFSNQPLLIYALTPNRAVSVSTWVRKIADCLERSTPFAISNTLQPGSF